MDYRTLTIFGNLCLSLALCGCAAAPSPDTASDNAPLFDNILSLSPARVAVNRIECTGGRISVSGNSSTLSGVSGYMVAVKNAGLQPELDIIHAEREGRRDFLFYVYPNDLRSPFCTPGARDVSSGASRNERR